MTYVDGCVTPVPTHRRADYVQHARTFAKLAREAGASEVFDGWGDDVKAGRQTDLRRAVDLEEGETVVFSWIAWPSRAARDEGWAKLMADPRMKDMAMPFDGKRMIFGGFESLATG